jgi:N6-L-threonylcarbamoyladenine synthase
MILALETSCDETSAALIHHGRVLSNIVSSQVKLHEEYGGVVPELAAREHLRNLAPTVTLALQQAQASPSMLSGIAATQGPGLPNALIVGLKAAQAMAYALRIPFVGIHHHEAHLYSPWITGTPPAADFTSFQANVSLIVSGGHTILVHIPTEGTHQLLGSTLDDAAGECFDKVGKLLGLPYPAGPVIDRLAGSGDPKAHDFPRPLIGDRNHEFSFSGLKTSVRYYLRDHPERLADPRAIGDLCASVQAAIVDVLVAKTMAAAMSLRVPCVTGSGGVTCNSALRNAMDTACRKRGLRLMLADKSLCTDNAAMIGILAERKLLRNTAGQSLDADIRPNWDLQSCAT